MTQEVYAPARLYASRLPCLDEYLDEYLGLPDASWGSAGAPRMLQDASHGFLDMPQKGKLHHDAGVKFDESWPRSVN
jgi:hypothetical protein